MIKYTDQEIYKHVSAYYNGKGLSVSDFSNRLYCVKCIFRKEWKMKDCIDFLEMREHWWEYVPDDLKRTKNRTRGQINTILKRMGMKLSREGLELLKK